VLAVLLSAVSARCEGLDLAEQLAQPYLVGGRYASLSHLGSAVRRSG
jgi:hypothetical protein